MAAGSFFYIWWGIWTLLIVVVVAGAVHFIAASARACSI